MSKKKKPAMTKEQAYDAKVSPLMAQIIAICKEHKIPVVASFGLGPDDNGDLHCTTSIVPDDFEPSEMLLELNARIYPPSRSPLFVNVYGADGKMIESNAIL